jgi:hypothetical protein
MDFQSDFITQREGETVGAIELSLPRRDEEMGEES